MHLSHWPIWATSLVSVASAVDIDWTSDSSITDGAAKLAYGTMSFYHGNNSGDVAGNLPDPYYWWEAGALFGTMVDYWAYTGDETYVDETYQALQHQMGNDYDFMPDNQTLTEGNDDQGFWALSAMAAAEYGFRNPPNGSEGGQWLAAAQAVFNEYVWRWDPSSCGGGLRWQIFTFNNGYNYKNTVSNGCFFNIASRLARYTGNTTYADWANKIYDWTTDVGFIDDKYNVYDGASDSSGDCTTIDKTQWTYTAGLYMHGAATMYNYTNGTNTDWEQRANGLVKRTANLFFKKDVMYEAACEPQSTCATDEYSFKAYLARFMSKTMQVMSSTSATIKPLLLASGKAAAEQCSGSAETTTTTLTGSACGMHWVDGSNYDGVNGLGQQMAGLSAVFYSQVEKAPSPYTAVSGGTSTGDSSGGSSKTDDSVDSPSPITAGDRAGAGILTTAALGGLLGGCAWLIYD